MNQERATSPTRPLAAARPRPVSGDLPTRVWRLFCSVRLALILILLLAAASLAGTLLLQAPVDPMASPQDYAAWVARTARPRYGSWTDALSALQLLAVFKSIWFRLLVGLLMTNIIICTINRWPGLWKGIAHPRVRMTDNFFRKTAGAARLPVAEEQQAAAEAALEGVLRRHHYRVVREVAGADIFLYADRFRYGKLGTFLSHTSLIVLLLGVFTGAVLGARDSAFMIPEGSTRPVTFDSSLSVQVEKFVDEYYPEGPPKDYRSDLVLYENGTEVKRQTIHVNEPMEYQGTRFYQSFFGPAVVLRVADAAGTVLYDDGIALGYQTGSGGGVTRPLGSADIASRGVSVYAIGPASGKNDPQIKAGQVQVEVYQEAGPTASGRPLGIGVIDQGQTKEIGGYQVTFERERQFTGLQVSRDPGAILIWIAAALLVVGNYLVFYFPHRRVWARTRTGEDGSGELLLATVSSRDLTLARDFEEIVAAARSAISQLPVAEAGARGMAVAGSGR